ncbi:MAG: FixH family protein [Myxococcales bacterium]|nr:FixH family protein [Myxococcales bacterium]
MLFALLACAEPQTETIPAVFEGTSEDGVVTWVLDFGTDPIVGDAEVVLTQSIDGLPLEVEPAIEPWMPDHGHGVSEPPVVEDLGGGEYAATWTWSMAGAWEVRLEADGHEGAIDVVVR